MWFMKPKSLYSFQLEVLNRESGPVEDTKDVQKTANKSKLISNQTV